MGNCLKRESGTQWGGEDWGSPVPDRFYAGNGRHGRQDIKDDMGNVEEEEEEERLLLGDRETTPSITEVKIKITKKQLEELLGRVDMKELSVEQVLAQLMNVSDKYETHQRSWRPNLQSIPE